MTDGFALKIERHTGKIKRYTDVVRFEQANDGVWIEFTEASRKPPLDVAEASVSEAVVE